jgi:hypothetical protein
MEALYRQLYGMFAMSAMDAKIEEQLGHNIPSADRELLTKIYESNDLDEREALIAERLGHHQQAEYLWGRVARKRAKLGQPAQD